MTAGRKKRFLEELAKHGNVKIAAQATHPHRAIGADSAFRAERERDPDFAAAWDEALEEAAALLEAEIHRRGVEGYEETREDNKGNVTIIRKFSDQCLLNLARFRIKGFGKQEVEAKVDAKVDAKIDLGSLASLSRESREELRRIIERECIRGTQDQP